MKTSESTTNIIKALIKAETEMERPAKDGVNPHFRSKYTTLDELLRCVNKALRANGLLLTPMLLKEEQTVGCKIVVHHESGEWMEAPAFFLPAAQTAQGYGSASTYVVRYAVSTFFSISTLEDDDGNSAAPAKGGATNSEVDKNKAIEMVKKVQSEAGIQDIDLLALIGAHFDKLALSALTMDELRSLFVILRDSVREVSLN